MIRLKLPNASYKVEIFDSVTDSWQESTSFSQLCYDYQENTVERTSTHTCDLFVPASIEAQSQAYLKFSSSQAGEFSQAKQEASDTSTIRTAT